MPGLATLTLFLLAAGVVLLTPGPAVLYIVTRSLEQGRRAGLISALGISLGTWVQVAAATLGLSSLLMKSIVAYMFLKYAGAAYLIYLGVKKFREGSSEAGAPPAASRSARHLFLNGALINVMNPKGALFLFAFLPQFVDPARGSVAAQVFLLGGIFAVMGMASDSAWAVLAGGARNWLAPRAKWWRRQNYVSGTVFIALGVAAAVSGSGRK